MHNLPVTNLLSGTVPRAGLRLIGLSLATILGSAVPAQAQERVPETTLQQPRLRIGQADGDPAYLLFGAQQALRLADGRIVVANIGTNEIRVYDARGVHVGTLGRRGDGPCEFRMLQQIGVIGEDSIAAYDIGNGRITVFGPAGAVARTSTVEPFGKAVLPRAFGFSSRCGEAAAAADLPKSTARSRLGTIGGRHDAVKSQVDVAVFATS
ncbi:hypothetical protein BH23GEM9_BH23GEM9_16960 [soil metagenome]